MEVIVKEDGGLVDQVTISCGEDIAARLYHDDGRVYLDAVGRRFEIDWFLFEDGTRGMTVEERPMSDENGQTALGIAPLDPRIGSKVAIINMKSVTGDLFVEGTAEVVRITDDDGENADYSALVRFLNGDVVPRFVDLSAQKDPQGYCDGLNKARAEMRAAALGRN